MTFQGCNHGVAHSYAIMINLFSAVIKHVHSDNKFLMTIFPLLDITTLVLYLIHRLKNSWRILQQNALYKVLFKVCCGHWNVCILYFFTAHSGKEKRYQRRHKK